MRKLSLKFTFNEQPNAIIERIKQIEKLKTKKREVRAPRASRSLPWPYVLRGPYVNQY